MFCSCLHVYIPDLLASRALSNLYPVFLHILAPVSRATTLRRVLYRIRVNHRASSILATAQVLSYASPAPFLSLSSGTISSYTRAYLSSVPCHMGCQWDDLVHSQGARCRRRTCVDSRVHRDKSHGDSAPVEPHGHEMPPPKRTRSGKATGILAAWSAVRTRRKSAARIPKTTINREPKEVGSGTRKLAAPNSKGNHRLPLLGPKFPQGWAEEDADGRLIWVEGSVGEGVVEEQQEQAQEDKLFEIS
jgi:hypothetical protein